MTHKTVCLVPRPWGAISTDYLEKVLNQEMAFHYYNFNRIEGLTLRAEGVTAIMKIHDNHGWMCKSDDLKIKPHPKEYFPVYVPCIFCSER
ncbi:orph-R1 [Microplitis demolitor]|uniref:hypothetical protein n=1 Tax=Microplitis demolitor TaxID=69319 RepID=UPI00044002CE|nr:hypothetical protein [Microplitis demolitor]KAG6558537.1 orph-R1 [Microplitis demolitor]